LAPTGGAGWNVGSSEMNWSAGPANCEESTLPGRAGAIANLGWHSEVEADLLAAAVRRLLDDPKELKEMGSRGIELMGGENFEGADGVVREMMGDGHAPA
jgi:hypothetical protein